MKKKIIIWTALMFVIVGCLTIYGFAIKKNSIGELSEEAMVEQVKKYLGLYQNLYPVKGGEVKFSSDRLVSEGYDPKLESECTGYVVVKNGNMGFEYKAYIKCPDYETKGYSKE